jgi:1-acyl-sn-glycerol-3-phosphate acyltransferase
MFDNITNFKMPEITSKTVFGKVFQIYTVLIIYPISWAMTAIVSTLILIFSKLISPRWASKVIGRAWGKVLLWIAFSPAKVIGAENVDRKQSYIIVCNHQSLYDILLVYGHLPAEIKWVMKKELEKMPFVGLACKTMGHVFVDRSNTEKAKQSLSAAKHLISDGVSAFFFPEGTRSKSGLLLPFKKGAFRMAKELNLPILPVTINGANSVMTPGSLSIFPAKVSLTIHKPISAEVYSEKDVNELSSMSKTAIASALEIKN